jgi:hypothetical protein
VADLNGNGVLDVVYPSTDGDIYAWDRFGNLLGGFPSNYASLHTQTTQCTPTIANLDADPQLEILFGDETGKLHGFNHNGTKVAGFPIQIGGEVRGSAAIWDCDSDNLVEIAVTGYDGYVYVWDLPFEFNPTMTPWPFFRHDTGNTGNFAQSVLPVAIDDQSAGAPSTPVRPALHPAVPNPFNPRTTLAFDVPGEAGGARHVELAIYDVTGRLVRQLVDGPIGAGSHAVAWDGRHLRGGAAASGIYFAQLRMGQFSTTRKLVMAR